MKTKTKALILNVVLVLSGFAVLWLMSGCDYNARASSTLAGDNLTGDTPMATPALPHRPFIGPEQLEAAYWSGVRDQAYSDYYLKPIYRTEEINGRVVLYKPIEISPMTEVQVAAKVAVDNQAVLDSKEKKK